MDASKLQDRGLKLGSGVDGQQLTTTLCSNWDTKKHRSCRRLGTKFCSRCRLVSYCSKECQKEDWEKHKEACKSDFMNQKYVPSWVNSGRLSSWVTSESAINAGEALYGNMPAHGVLGADERLPSNLKFCFAAAADLRNVFATIGQLPDSFRGRLTLYINDGNPRVVARHFLILELLRVYGYDAIDAAIAVWYSSCLTSQQSRAIDEVVGAVKSSADLRGAREYFSTTKSSLIASFGKEVCVALQEMRCINRTRESAVECRRAVMLSRPDLVDRKLACLKPQHRVVWFEYRKSGMLLPLDHVFKVEHGCPNKYILHPVFGWTISDASEPLDGWIVKDVVAAGLKHGVSEKNLYGCLFFYLREQLKVFLDKLQVCQIRLHLYCEDARDLSTMHLKEGTRLHRVDTSNLADSSYVGIERILEDWGPLLQRKGQFKAVLISSHMNWHAMGEADGIFENLSSKEFEAAMRLCSQRKDKHCEELCKEGFSNGDFSMMHLFHDFSSRFSKYLKLQNAYEAAKHAGLVAREQHQVVPHRIGAGICDEDKCFPGMTASIEELYYLTMLHNRTLTERYTEWVPVS